MTDRDLLTSLETGTLAHARSVVAASPAGFEQLLFDELRRAVGEDPVRALRLARAGEGFAGDRVAWAHRFRAVRHRLGLRWQASASEYLSAERACADPVEGAAMAVGAIDSLARAGRVRQATNLGERLIAVLPPLDAGRASLNVGNALLWHDKVEEAIPYLERAQELLTHAPIERGAALLGLSTAQIDFGTAAQVRGSAQSAIDVFESLGLPHYARLAAQNLVQADLMSGRLDDALQRLLRLRGEFAHGTEEYARNEQHLGETYLRLNMPAEARQAFSDALDCRAMAKLRYNRAQCLLGQAEAEMELGLETLAVQSAERSRRLFLQSGNKAGAALAASLVSNKVLDIDALVLALDELERHGLRRRTAEVLFALADSGSDRGAHKRGRKIVNRFGLVDLEWRMHVSSARTGHASKQLDSYRAMAQSMWQTRAMHRSTAARQHFLRDKDHALREYIGVLLERPNEDNVSEALQVLADARSVSLIDEIVFARGESLTAQHHDDIERLREEINAAIRRDEGLGGNRRSKPLDIGRWRREWHEAVWPLIKPAVRGYAAPADVCYVQAASRFHRIEKGQSTCVAGAREVVEATKWLGFALMEPVVSSSPCVDSALAELERYRSLIELCPAANGTTIMPDESLWQAPWAALYEGSEVVISLAPAFREIYAPDTTPRKMTVWYQASERLPHIQREVDEVCRMFPGAKVCSNAREVRESLEGGETDLLHIATHAALNVSNPMFSYLQFDDGAVFAAEIARGSLRPRLVTMSACDSGALSAIESNEPDGLVRAALALGAESVVASMWPLHDEASAIFCRPYYECLKQTTNVLGAVAQGRKSVKSKYAHPYYWGAMVVFGGYQRQ